MQANGGVDEKLHVFFTSALRREFSDQLHTPDSRYIFSLKMDKLQGQVGSIWRIEKSLALVH
jgi:hypothetical protein